ncbi:putative damage-inducible protein DinB [Actinokineospora baliensis]|uniref:DinB family protein n=1 Tax=Actinokineospora baliensis TaxID=547056 RepID=UPI00195BF50E|nr:DinB family protein [Actinokineospora baliensis]MBM7775783.1 putative damage-inducible protein DinB [Actinokineospora baliensis]
MTDTPVNDPRVEPPYQGDERELLSAFLDYLRATIAFKSEGLSEADTHRSVLPSPLMTVAGLLSHLRWVEAYWFEVALSGQPNRAPYSAERPDGEFEIAANLTTAELLADYAQQCERSREVTAGLALDDTVAFRDGKQLSLRWVLIHMIEETGRHAGHLDVIREFLDGATGE